MQLNKVLTRVRSFASYFLHPIIASCSLPNANGGVLFMH